MSPIRLLPLLVLLLAALLPVHRAVAQTVSATAVDSIFRAFDGTAGPGCAVAAYHDGRVVFSRGYGMADLQHGVVVRPGSIFHVASISKQFTSMAIALLEADGVLSLDDEVRQWVPELHDFGERITLRHLNHHTSGLRDQWELLSMGGWRPDDPKSQDDILWLVSRQRELNFPPGDQYLYSNTGHTLLAVIVERASGMSFRAFTEERIFRPLGMTSTHFHDDHTMIVPGRTSAYQPRQGGGWRISIPVFDNAGATSLFTTVEDMAKWDHNFVDPVVGGAAVLARMQEAGRLNDGEAITYALGLMHGEYRGLRTVGHSGSDAGYRGDFTRFPEEGWSFATFCNTSTANAPQLNRRVAEVVLGDRMEVVAEDAQAGGGGGGGFGGGAGASAPSASPEELAAYVGDYRSEELDVTWRIERGGDGLVLRRRRFDDRMVQLREDDRLQSGNWSLQMTRDAGGVVEGFRITSGRVRNLRFERLADGG